jgi:tRNA threonylcarbamoyl adenosine modification protein (Sua5/YciO/YrdC/YwlC family)
MTAEVIQALGPATARAAQRGAKALRAGQLVGFATETLKNRPRRPFSVHLGRATDVGGYVRDLPLQARWLIARAWPGPVTLLVPTGGRLADPAYHAAGLHDVLCPEGTIGLRCPAAPAAQAMLVAAGGPAVATSANLAGGPSPRSAEEVLAAVGDRIDLLLDSGPTAYGRDSTIVRFAPGGWEIVRRGVYDEKEIRALTRWTVLFVCTGNTCRSPIAAGLAAAALAKRLGCEPADLAGRGVRVFSAGTGAVEGAAASAEAVRVAGEWGADLGGHRSRKLTTELIREADLVCCMAAAHATAVLRLVPSAAGKVRRLCDDGDVPDPIGAGLDGYRRTATRIQDAVASCLDREFA